MHRFLSRKGEIGQKSSLELLLPPVLEICAASGTPFPRGISKEAESNSRSGPGSSGTGAIEDKPTTLDFEWKWWINAMAMAMTMTTAETVVTGITVMVAASTRE